MIIKINYININHIYDELINYSQVKRFSQEKNNRNACTQSHYSRVNAVISSLTITCFQFLLSGFFFSHLLFILQA